MHQLKLNCGIESVARAGIALLFHLRQGRYFTWRGSLAMLLSSLLILMTGAAPQALAMDVSRIHVPPPAMPKHVRTGPKGVKIFKPKLSFSAAPSDLEFETAHLFWEPLVPMHVPGVAGENPALAKALLSYKAQKDQGDISVLKNFIAQFPKSRWTPSLKVNLARHEFERGYITPAMSDWRSVWNATKTETGRQQKCIADEAISQICVLEAKLGRKDDLEKDLQEINKRSVSGSVERKIKDSKEGLWCLKNHPEYAYKCGPFALNSILNFTQKKPAGRNPLMSKACSTEKGTNLWQLKQWSEQLGLHYQPAKRTAGAKIITPCVMHWKASHFAAVTEIKKGKLHLVDPTFGYTNNFWLDPKVLDSESDGYFLVPGGSLPEGWATVSEAEASNVWGKGDISGRQGGMTPCQPSKCPDGTCCGKPCGMARLAAWAMQAALNISDIPLGYAPPIGPAMDFLINYNYGEGNQPGNPQWPNLGPEGWSLNWVSFLTVDASQNVTINIPGGGYETYAYSLPDNVSNPYPPELTSQAMLTVVGDGIYQRQLPNGSIQVYNQPDGNYILMTQVIDPQGNSTYITYDGNYRITAITDAIGQVSTLTYLSNTIGNSGYYTVTGISDPFSRTCSFTYDPLTSTKLQVSTDVIGIQSQFEYDPTGATSMIDRLTTPYGTTTFRTYSPSNSGPYLGVGLQVYLPDGTTSVIENWINEVGQTYFWDREAMALYPNDPANQVYTHCETTQWQLIPGIGPFMEAPVTDYVIPPLENQTTYTYAGQTTDFVHNFVGPSNKPITISRIVSGATAQTWNYQYNTFGRVTQAVDPVGRTFSYKYDANNIDLLEKRQNQSGNNDLLGKWEYNNTQHVPNVYIDGSGQKTQYTYNSYGEMQTLTDALSNVWTLTYNGNGYLTQVQGPLSGTADVTTISYDGYGRVYQVTDSEGYTLTYSYDLANRLTQVTYPDGTSEQTVYNNMDAVMRKDRIGRWTTDSYDSMDQISYEVDPLGRKTQYTWCACGSLSTLTDPAGNVTTWQHDLEGRVNKKIYADTSNYQYSYDAVGRLSTRTDALSQITTYSYNLDNTLSQVVYTNTVNPTSTVYLTYDPNYPRISTVQNGWGTYTYSYNPYITDPYGTPTTGGGMLSGVTNNVIANSAISYSYDALGRTTNRSINGAANSITWSYDAMSRITQEVNALGTFNYAYVDDTSGSSKGTTRLASISYPNGQQTNFTWYGNTGDQRLQSINNLLPSGAPLSQFSYGYDSAGEITRWGQQSANVSPRVQNLGYDLAGQLTSSQSGFGATPPKYADQYSYSYDSAANRTSVQTSLSQTANITGTITSGDTLTITATDPALSGGTESVNYVVQAGDTLSSISTNLAAALTADSNLQSIGVSAAASSNQITIKSTSANITTYAQSTSGGATESIALGISANAVQNATIGGTVSSGDVLTLTAFDAALGGGSASVNYIATGGDTLNSLASNLASAVNSSGTLSAAGITATATENVVHIKSTSSNLTTYSQGLSTSATETIYLALSMNGPQTVLVGGSKTTGDVLGINVYDSTLSGGTEAVAYTVQSSDTLSSIASSLASAINSDTNLQNIGVSASSSGTLITISSISTGATTYSMSRPNTATETLVAGLNPNGVETAAIGGSATSGDTVTVTVYDAGISGGSKAESYNVTGGDTLTSIATNLAAVIAGDSTLSALGITASAASNVVNIKSTSNNLTTYTKSTSGGATETITLGQSTGITQYGYNNLNELTSTAGGGKALYQGTTNKPIKSATINGTVAATLPTSTSFSANATLSTGNNASTVNAVDGNNNSVTNTYQISAQAGPTASLTYDSNGNMTSDGTNSYSWDAENRLTQITYPGSDNNSQFAYDGFGRNVSVVEVTGGSTTSTKIFAWCDGARCEQRDSGGSVGARFFGFGETIGGNSYFSALDHLGSVRNLVDTTGIIQAEYLLDPYGRIAAPVEAVQSDFGYANYYWHRRSGSNLTLTREYNPDSGRWIDRDIIGERGGINLYQFVYDDPLGFIDPFGTQYWPAPSGDPSSYNPGAVWPNWVPSSPSSGSVPLVPPVPPAIPPVGGWVPVGVPGGSPHQPTPQRPKPDPGPQRPRQCPSANCDPPIGWAKPPMSRGQCLWWCVQHCPEGQNEMMYNCLTKCRQIPWFPFFPFTGGGDGRGVPPRPPGGWGT